MQPDLANMKQVTTIIATYNSMKWIDQCLGSLFESTYPTNVIIVDNNSTDGTPDKIEKEYPQCELIRSDENLGFAKANNLGINIALQKGADYLFLFNHDAWVKPNTVQTLLDIAEKHPKCGILSPMHLNGTGIGLDFMFSSYIESDKCPGLLSDIYLKRDKEYYPIENVNAAAWFVRRELFLEVGLFDPIFHMYGEDNNFVDRVHHYGYKLGVTPKTYIYHDRENRTNRFKDETRSLLDQKTRMMVIALNPRQTPVQRIFTLFRKIMSDVMSNLQSMQLGIAFRNGIVFIQGIYYSFRYRNRHLKLKKEMETMKS